MLRLTALLLLVGLLAEYALAQDSLNVRRLSLVNTDANGVTLRDCLAYVTGGGGLQIMDISDPLAPVEVGFVSTNTSLCVAVQGNYAYVSSLFGLHVIDIASPATPAEVGFVSTFTASWGIAVSGNYVYLPADYQGLVIVDISSPTAPAVISTFPIVSELWAVAVDGNYAYVAATGLGLRVFDISNPAAPFEVGSFMSGSAYTEDVIIDGDYAYLADDYAVHVLNIASPSTPTLVGTYTGPGAEIGLAKSGDFLIVGEIDPGSLRVLDVANPASPVEVGFYELPGLYPARLDAQNGIVAVAEIGGSICDIYDIRAAQGIGVPRPPAELVVSVLPTATDVRLDWLPVTLDLPGNPVAISGYTIYSTDDPAESIWEVIADPAPPTSTTFVDTRAPAEQRRYRVQAVTPYEPISCP